MTAQCRPEATLLSARVLSSPVGRWDRVVKFCWIPVRVAGEPGMLRALEALEDCARRLTAEGIDAAAHSADAGDERQLTAALDSVGRRFGGIDVLQLSPMPFTEMPRYRAAATTVDDVMHHLRVQTPAPSCLRGESCRGCCSAAAAACFSP